MLKQAGHSFGTAMLPAQNTESEVRDWLIADAMAFMDKCQDVFKSLASGSSQGLFLVNAGITVAERP